MDSSSAPTEIDEITISENGELFVRPLITRSEDFTYVWRDASGIRWNADRRALCAAEPTRWRHADLFRQMLLAVHREYGQRLIVVPETRWAKVDDETRREIEAQHEAIRFG